MRRPPTLPSQHRRAPVTIRPTSTDRAIANAVASSTTPELEKAAGFLTWGADEKLLLALSVGVPHLLKRAVDQTRPDRLTVKGHWRGVPWSGRARDAFPSGHALHMGALASAADLFPQPQRRIVRGLAVTLSATRILLLAHWTSDVFAGFAAGALIERLIRTIPLRGQRRSGDGT
jgi:membrane-associated phospholipid phosphatase